jgi:4-hydroxy-tetrahydrodipicolinate synthase
MSLSKVITVIPTFFNEDESIDYLSIHRHIVEQINNQIKTIVILGTTSETPTISIEERISIATFVFDNFSTNVTIVVGLGGNNTREMLNELQYLEQRCHAIMISQPYYNKPSQEGIFQHYKLLTESTRKNIIIYNIPSRCGVNIEPITIKRICETCPNIIAIKEASGNLEQMIQIIDSCPPHVKLYSGDDGLILPVLSIGGVGVISVVSNIVPKDVINIIDNFESNLLCSQLSFYKIKPLIKFCFVESNPVPLKYVMSIINNKPSLALVRLPLVELTQESKNKYPTFEF